MTRESSQPSSIETRLAHLRAGLMAWQLKRRNHFLLPMDVSLGPIDYRREAMTKLADSFATHGTEVTMYGRGTLGDSPMNPDSLGIREHLVVTERQGESTGETMRGSSITSSVMKLGELANGRFIEYDTSSLHFEPIPQAPTQHEQQ